MIVSIVRHFHAITSVVESYCFQNVDYEQSVRSWVVEPKERASEGETCRMETCRAWLAARVSQFLVRRENNSRNIYFRLTSVTIERLCLSFLVLFLG